MKELCTVDKAQYQHSDRIRISLGSAIRIGLLDGMLAAEPTTVYLLTATSCTAKCSFCSQATDRVGGRLSRVSWPVFRVEEVLEAIASSSGIKRVCLQTTNHSKVFEESLYLVELIKNKTGLPVSLSSPPFVLQQYKALKNAGVEMVGISFDGSTPKIFDSIKGRGVQGPYRWKDHMAALNDALKVFGTWQVRSHLIVGLGETEKEVIELIDRFYSSGVLTSLFAFTPLRGTPLESRKPPDLASYRRIQVARYLINNKLAEAANMSFDSKGILTGYGIDQPELSKIIENGEAFMTSGCPDCNRPFYNDSPSKHRTGDLYNFPTDIDPEHLHKILDSLFDLGD
ncbi:MAG: radical SAM protein [Candidatus Odinarchaeota archaeon]